MEKRSPFIMTQDEEVANQLTHRGFNLISDANKLYIFSNSYNLAFDNIDQTKITFTNVLCL